MNKLLIYFGTLLTIMVFRSSTVPPSLVWRILFILALFIPLIIKGKKIYLPCLITFLTINFHSFAYGFLPYDVAAYAFICLSSVLLYKNKHCGLNIGYVIAFLYVFFVNVIYSGDPQNIFWCICTLGCCSCIDRNNHQESQGYMLKAFSIISIILSFLYLLNYDSFLATYSAEDNVTRSGWTDPNYLSCILGMGALSSLILLLRGYSQKILINLLYILVVIVTIMAQSLMASRGGLMALSLSTVVLLFFLKIRRRYKLTILLLFCLFITWLYTDSYFELLSYRMENDSVDSGRMDIWSMKLSIFFNEGNVFHWLFGVGYENAFSLSNTSEAVGFHNDFLAILCAYGIVGLVLFIYMILIRPLNKIHRASRPVVITLLTYLCVVCFTLEPMSSGDVTYWAFYYMILLFSSKYKVQSLA